MSTHVTHQEILLATGSSFAHREWVSTDAGDRRQLSSTEELERACWNGLVRNTLPELDLRSETGQNLWLWQVRATQSFLELEFSDYPSPKEKEYSIDPYTFLVGQEFN